MPLLISVRILQSKSPAFAVGVFWSVKNLNAVRTKNYAVKMGSPLWVSALIFQMGQFFMHILMDGKCESIKIKSKLILQIIYLWTIAIH